MVKNGSQLFRVDVDNVNGGLSIDEVRCSSCAAVSKCALQSLQWHKIHNVTAIKTLTLSWRSCAARHPDPND